MVRLRPTVLIAGLAGGAIPASRLSLVGVQLVNPGRMVWVKKKSIIIRNVPYTAVAPRPSQAAIRALLGQIAKAAKGQKGLKRVDGDLLPPAAAAVKLWWKANRDSELVKAIKALNEGKTARRTLRTADDNLKVLERVNPDLASKIRAVTFTLPS